jgi:hypothetical protein
METKEERIERIVQERLGYIPDGSGSPDELPDESPMEIEEEQVIYYEDVPVRSGTKPLPALPGWVSRILGRKQPMDVPSDGFNYWIPKPSLKSWRVVGLLLVNLATALGLCSFAVLGFAFGQLGDVSEGLRWWFILIGSVSLGLGSELGTLVTVVEIFRKTKTVPKKPLLARFLISVLTTARTVRVVIDALGQIYKDPAEKSFNQAIKMIDRTLQVREGGASIWDWVGLIISACTSLSAVALAQVSILQLVGVSISYTWLPVVQQWSPAALALFGVLDGYVNHMEYGMFLARFDEMVREWFRKREEAKRETEKKYGW